MNLTPYDAKYFAYELTKHCPSGSIEKLAGQKQIKTLESQRNARRRALFDAQGDIDRRREQLIAEIEGKLHQKTVLGWSRASCLKTRVAETDNCIYLLEPKARNEMTDADVLAKKDAAVRWCEYATKHAVSNGGKPLRHALIPHDLIAENMTLSGLVG